MLEATVNVLDPLWVACLWVYAYFLTSALGIIKVALSAEFLTLSLYKFRLG